MTIGEDHPATPRYKTPKSVALDSREVSPRLGFLQHFPVF
jgi:hypothetical protein